VRRDDEPAAGERAVEDVDAVGDRPGRDAPRAVGADDPVGGDRVARAALRRQARDDELRDREEQRRRRREDAKSSRQQMSFGEFTGSKIASK